MRSRYAVSSLIVTFILLASPLQASGGGAGQASGTVTISGIVSKYVELTSGGAPSLSGQSAGGSATLLSSGENGTPFSVAIDLGEVGPSNVSPWVTATVPLRLRSNAPYSLSIRTLAFQGGSSDITAADIGFGLDHALRSGPGTGAGGAGLETAHNPGDPTLAPSSIVDGRFTYTAANGDLADFLGGLTQVLSGPRILTPVPRFGAGSLTVDAIFAVKPQFYSTGVFHTVVDFILAAP